MLEVLDSSDWPKALRDRAPRMIQIQHADVNDVQTIVRDVYKDYMENEQAQQARAGANMMAAMFGGGRGGQQQSQQQPPARLAIGVDARTNQLIVSASDELFREIEGLVESIDRAAEAARRTVRVVPIENTDPTLLQSTLGSLIPRVKVSTTGGRSQPNANTQPQPSNGGNNPNQDAMRQAFEQRMRERMQQGGNPFGGGGGGGQGGGGRGFGGGGGFGGGFPGFFGGQGFGGGQGGNRGGGQGGGGRGGNR
jgi:hypothetical protein